MNTYRISGIPVVSVLYVMLSAVASITANANDKAPKVALTAPSCPPGETLKIEENTETVNYDGKDVQAKYWSIGCSGPTGYNGRVFSTYKSFAGKTLAHRWQDGPFRCEAVNRDGRFFEGVLTRYYPNGNRREEITVAGGLANGTMKRYYSDGRNLSMQAEYTDGKALGPYKLFYNNGMVKEEGTNGPNHTGVGVTKQYAKDGSLTRSVEWVGGFYYPATEDCSGGNCTKEVEGRVALTYCDTARAQFEEQIGSLADRSQQALASGDQPKKAAMLSDMQATLSKISEAEKTFEIKCLAKTNKAHYICENCFANTRMSSHLAEQIKMFKAYAGLSN